MAFASTEHDYRLFDSFTQGVQVVDAGYRYLYINAAAARHGRTSREHLLGRTMVSMYPGIEGTAMFEALRRCMEQREPARALNQFTFPDGTSEYFQLRMEPVADGVLITSLDVTEERQQLLWMRHASEDLERRVQRRTAELAARNRELSRLAYATSHDLKAPLRTVRGFSEALLEDYADALEEPARELLHRIHDGAERMNRTIEALLQHAVIGQREQAQAVHLDQVVSEVLEDLSAAIEREGGVVHVGPLPTVTGYRAELRSLFQNLIGNALRYHAPGERPVVEISSRPDDEDPDAWRISVRDEGIGIPPEDHERIFEMFERLHDDGTYPGSGMGLAHCDKIVGLHGGEIWLRSRPGQGTTFFFTLRPPLEKPGQASGF